MSEHNPNSYYVPASSRWPFIGAIGLFVTVYGAANFIQQSTDAVANDGQYGAWIMFAGIAILIWQMFSWWRDVIRESMGGLYSPQMDRSFRFGMMWFITSEVMFFAAFFGALFYARVLAIEWLGGGSNNAMTHDLLWPDFIPEWPLERTPDGTTTNAMPAWGIPLINTAILLTSSWTLTLAHHALKDGHRSKLNGWLAVTVLLGAIFLGFQGYEYYHAYVDMGLTMGSGIYGSTFFLLTGFHGMHVTIGTIFLAILLVRTLKGHFTAENHFAFEAGAWYWHFVDVVWLFLFVFVYLL